mmetsp:Transcript_73336/g.220284  ORF Transcript_73336/g.220284 Transcript_73336/m.220284 type:complete len:425 (+) Transcript_73336:43-1317(+)
MCRSSPTSRDDAMGEEVEDPDKPWKTEAWLNHEYYRDAATKFNHYDPTLWGPTLSLRMTAFMFYPWAIITTLVTVLTWFLEAHKEFIGEFSLSTDAHIVMGGTLSFLVVFRTNASYDRWWEARCAWQTVITNSRTLVAMAVPTLVNEEAREAAAGQLIAFVVSLKAYLRDEMISEEELGPRMNPEIVAMLNSCSCMPIMALRILSHTARVSLPQDDPDTEFDEASLAPPIYGECNEALRGLSTQMGTMERIKMTPMVFGYVATLRFFLILWLVTLPIALVGEYNWVAPPALSMIAYLFINVEQMAIEIEQPFGDDANDLPLELYILDLEKVVRSMRAHQLSEGASDVLEGFKAPRRPSIIVRGDPSLCRQNVAGLRPGMQRSPSDQHSDSSPGENDPQQRSLDERMDSWKGSLEDSFKHRPSPS